MNKFFTKSIRRFLIGRKQQFIFNKTTKDNFSFDKIEETNLYIHIPFCKSICPYCPYNRVLYEEKLIGKYFEALTEEIDIYANRLGNVKINSIYIGGGTPTNVIDELLIIIEKIKNKFKTINDIAIETTVADINHENLSKLKSMGVTMLSIGVQSFNDKYLKLLGRKYTSKDIKNAFETLRYFHFDTVNIDLIFAFPNQTKEELLDDIKKAKQLQINQITAYPLFTFPYSNIGKYLKIKNIQMPNFFKRKRFYNLIYNYFKKDNNYKMVSVWSFRKNASEQKKYSSVTRKQYIGLGAGAGSRLNDIFYFNTFSIKEYENLLLNKNKLPIAIEMPISEKLSDYYWLYWKLYETNFSFEKFQKIADRKMKFILRICLFLNFCKKTSDNNIQLTKKGAFWIHLAQNYFMLDYINKVWETMKKENIPEKIEF